jgi:hypothetical protein
MQDAILLSISRGWHSAKISSLGRGVGVEEQYSYLWNGSQPGWVLLCIDGQRFKLTIEFAEGGPSAREFGAIRKVVPEFQALSLSSVIERLKAQSSLPLGEFESSEARRLVQSCKDVGLTVTQLVRELPCYLLVNELTKSALLIEDDDLANRVKETALKRLVPVRHIEV